MLLIISKNPVKGMREGLEKKARSIVELDEKCESALIAAINLRLHCLVLLLFSWCKLIRGSNKLYDSNMLNMGYLKSNGHVNYTVLFI